MREALETKLRAAGGHLLYSPGAPLTGPDTGEIAGAVTAATQAGVLVVAVGEDAGNMTGEASARPCLSRRKLS